MRRQVAKAIGVVVVVLAASGLLAAGALADTVTLQWPQATELTGAAGGSSGLSSVSCSAPGNCAAIGTYGTTSEVVTESGGTWGAPVQIQPPSGGVGAATPNAIACPQAGDCVVAGTYTDASGGVAPMVDRQSTGVWGPSTPIAPPPNATSDTLDYGPVVDGIACAGVGNCAMVGHYYTASKLLEAAMVASETGGHWGAATAVALPSSAPAGAYAFLLSVTCAAPGSCTAVGGYQAGGNENQGTQVTYPLVVSETSGTWGRGAGLTPPATPTQQGQYEIASLASVSCGGPGDCAAVGRYDDAQDREQGLLASEQNGTWGATSELTPPANVSTGSLPDVQLRGVSCPAAAGCEAVGAYYDLSGNEQLMVAAQDAGGWAQAAEVTPPAGAGSQDTPAFSAIACPTAAPSCLAVGDYEDSAATVHALYDTGSIGTLTANPPPAPSYVAAGSSSVSAGTVAVAWAEPQTSSPISAYVITEETLSDQPVLALPTIVSGSADSATISGLTNCMAYKFVVRAVGPGGVSAATSSAFAFPHWTPTGEPSVAVILMEGVDSPSYPATYYATGQGSLQHPGVGSYCYASDGYVKTPFPSILGEDGAKPGLMTNFNPTGLPGPGTSMTDSLATHPGVVFLPWGWDGAWMSSDQYGALMHVSPAPSDAAEAGNPGVEAAELAEEVESVHRVWPNTRIVILAHSLGGMVAELYWHGYWQSDHNGVVRTIALDAPLNGIKYIGLCLPEWCAHFSTAWSAVLAAAWATATNGVSVNSGGDANGSFLPVGNPDDSTYGTFDYNDPGLLSQLFFNCSGFSFTCTPMSPAFVDPCPDPDHGSVKYCPEVISYVDAAALGSADARDPAASAARARRSGSAPLLRAVRGEPYAQLVREAVSPGGLVAFRGSLLGSSRGTLEVSVGRGRYVPAAILRWSPNAITARVPRKAVTGAIRVTTAARTPVAASGIAVLRGSTRAHRLKARLLSRGHTAHLLVTVLSRSDRRLARTAVTLFDGEKARSGRTDGRGVASFTIPMLTIRVVRTYVVISGRTWRLLKVAVPPAHVPALHLSVPRHPRPGSSVRATLRIREAGRPVRGAHVEVAVLSPTGPVILPEQVRADRAGIVTIRFTEPTAGGAMVVAATAWSSTTATIP